jgi:hypothetical protein
MSKRERFTYLLMILFWSWMGCMSPQTPPEIQPADLLAPQTIELSGAGGLSLASPYGNVHAFPVSLQVHALGRFAIHPRVELQVPLYTTLQITRQYWNQSDWIQPYYAAWYGADILLKFRIANPVSTRYQHVYDALGSSYSKLTPNWINRTRSIIIGVGNSFIHHPSITVLQPALNVHLKLIINIDMSSRKGHQYLDGSRSPIGKNDQLNLSQRYWGIGFRSHLFWGALDYPGFAAALDGYGYVFFGWERMKETATGILIPRRFQFTLGTQYDYVNSWVYTISFDVSWSRVIPRGE